MRCLITIFLFLSCTIGRAQLAPNFTVTDFEGMEINLYEDLLDEGKTVLIEFFFLDCVPCIDLSPNLELFYQDWGGGNDEVELLAISHEDDSIAEYAAINGLNFPMIGIDGDGIAVYDEFSSGSYGEFLGHPTFVIIAPDGTMAFNPIEDDVEMLVSVNNVLEQVVDAGTVGIGDEVLSEFRVVVEAGGNLTVHSNIPGQLSIHSTDGKKLHFQDIEMGRTSFVLSLSGQLIFSFKSAAGLESTVIYLPLSD